MPWSTRLWLHDGDRVRESNACRLAFSGNFLVYGPGILEPAKMEVTFTALRLVAEAGFSPGSSLFGLTNYTAHPYQSPGAGMREPAPYGVTLEPVRWCLWNQHLAPDSGARKA